ncbi:MAG: AI-2E family transporter [Candidatus Hydrothermarchaeales archaeon]
MKKDMEWAILGILIALLFIFSLFVVRPVLDALIVAAFFAYLTYPLTSKLEEILKNRTLAAFSVVALAILPLILIGVQLVNIYSNEFSKISEIRFSSPMLNIDWDSLSQSVMSEVQSQLSPEKALKGISIGVVLVIKVFIVMAGAFYMLRERIVLRKFLISLAPPQKEDIVAYFLDTVDGTFYGVFMGHLMTSLFTGIIAGIGFAIIGSVMGVQALMTYPFLLGMIVAVATLLPIVGAYLVYLPIAVYLFITGQTSAAIVLLVFGSIVLSLLPDIIVRPYISGKKGKTHPFILLLGFISGPIAFGPLGLILGPAILGLFKATLDTYRVKVMGK